MEFDFCANVLVWTLNWRLLTAWHKDKTLVYHENTHCIRPTNHIILFFCSSLYCYGDESCVDDISRALRIIYGYAFNYNELLILSGIETLYKRRRSRCSRLFHQKHDPSHHLLPDSHTRSNAGVATRLDGRFRFPKCRTERFQKSFVIYCTKTSPSILICPCFASAVLNCFFTYLLYSATGLQINEFY